MLLVEALRNEQALREWVGDRSLETPTERSIGTVEELHAELLRIREHGYSIDDGENEPGVNCLAVPVYLTSPTMPSGAVSISGIAYRTPVQRLIDDLPAIRAIVAGQTENP
jgi:IclR family acetate operon transcriptional repressor